MKTNSMLCVLAFATSIAITSCGNSGSGSSSGSGDGGGESPKQVDCAEIDDYIESATNYVDKAADGTLDMSDAQEMMQDCEKLGNEIESKGESAFSQECWDRFITAQRQLVSKANKAASDAAAAAGVDLSNPDEMMKDMESQMEEMGN